MATQQTVLLVDDEEDVRLTLVRMLESCGTFTVAQADSGASALRAAQRLNGTLGLVVTDIGMPDMDGLELTRALRALNPKMPVVFITGSDAAVFAEAGLEAEVLQKPFGLDALQQTVARLMAS